MSKRTKHIIIGIVVILILCLCGALYLHEKPAHHAKPVRTERTKDNHYKSTGNNHMKSDGSNHYKSTGSNHYK